MAVNLSPVGGVAAQFFTSTGAVLTGGKLYTYAAGTTTPATTYTSSNGLTAWTNPIVLDAAGRVPGSGEIWLTDGINYKFVLKDANDVLIATYDNISGINSNFVAYSSSQEIQTATAGQTVFTLTTMQYQPATNSLSVFVDGVNQYGSGAQYAYVETDSTTVTFNTGLHVGAEVKFTTTQQQGAGAVDASQVTYDPPFTGSVATNVEAKLAQYISVKDFGAVGDGVTDDTTAIQDALDSGVSNVYVPNGTYLVSSALNVPQGTILFGASKNLCQIKLDTAAPNGTHVLSLQPFATIRDLWIRGNWDLATTGQDGVGIYAKNLAVAMHGLTIENVQVDRCKSVGLYVYEGAYFRVYNLISDTHGLDAVYLEGASAGSFTSTEIGGMSTFSSCPNGYGLRLKNCHSSKYTFVSEYTNGVAFEGNHRALTFDSCYFETPASGTQDYIYNMLSGGAFGLTIQNNYLGMVVQTSVIQGDPNYQYCLLVNNNNLSTAPYLNSNYKNWTVLNAGRVTKALGVNCILDSKYTATGNVGTGEDTLYTYDLPGNTLSINGEGIRIRAWGKTAANANNKTLKLYFGSLLFNSGAIAVNDKDWVLDAVILRAGNNDQTASVSGLYNGSPVIVSTLPTQTMANDITIKVTGEATADNDIFLIGAVVEQLNAQNATF